MLNYLRVVIEMVRREVLDRHQARKHLKEHVANEIDNYLQKAYAETGVINVSIHDLLCDFGTYLSFVFER